MLERNPLWACEVPRDVVPDVVDEVGKAGECQLRLADGERGGEDGRITSTTTCPSCHAPKAHISAPATTSIAWRPFRRTLRRSCEEGRDRCELLRPSDQRLVLHGFTVRQPAPAVKHRDRLLLPDSGSLRVHDLARARAVAPRAVVDVGRHGAGHLPPPGERGADPPRR